MRVSANNLRLSASKYSSISRSSKGCPVAGARAWRSGFLALSSGGPDGDLETDDGAAVAQGQTISPHRTVDNKVRITWMFVEGSGKHGFDVALQEVAGDIFAHNIRMGTESVRVAWAELGSHLEADVDELAEMRVVVRTVAIMP